jgi:hypothetical protein
MIRFNAETNQFGLDADEAEMASYGFAGGKLLGSPNRAAFTEAWEPYRQRREQSGLTNGQETELLWLDAALSSDTAAAIEDWRVDTPDMQLALDAQPPLRADSIEYAKARFGVDKALTAIQALGKLTLHDKPA